MTLFSYVVARDYGFAPNPFGGYCTLATCKPDIRASAQVGDWIVGTGSATQGRAGYLVYAMKVEETCTFDEYWNDPRFESKKPNLHASKMLAFGDNIYHHDVNGNWIQVDSHHSYHDGTPNDANIERDTKADRVLIATQFSYFGGDGPEIPDFLRNYRGYDLCKSGPGHRRDAPDDMVKEFISWYLSLSASQLEGLPIDWSRTE
jgi:hypothetical protein